MRQDDDLKEASNFYIVSNHENRSPWLSFTCKVEGKLGQTKLCTSCSVKQTVLQISRHTKPWPGAHPGFFLGGGALVSCSTSTPINHIVFFFLRKPVALENRRSCQGGVRTPCTLPLDPPLLTTDCLGNYRLLYTGKYSFGILKASKVP